jgi:riboflavin kinase / FMN adenylyltransferase
MRVHLDLEALPTGIRVVVTVGVFDGMHRGHRAVVCATVAGARRLRAVPVVVTFSTHPDALFRGVAPPLLCDPEEKLARLAAAGVEHVVVQPFDRAFADQSADEFVARLRDGRDLAGIVMAPGSAIGRGRAGTPQYLAAIGERAGFGVHVVPTLRTGGERVSASRIRGLLERGQLAQAQRLLGWQPAVIGTVVEGAGRGRDLGFRTANVAFPQPVALPCDGIYAVEASWGGLPGDPLRPAQCAGGVASLGVRPTFGAGERLLEVHLFDVDRDLYGARLRVAWVRRQRGERHFRSVQALVAQMDRDAVRARRLLAAHGGPTPTSVATCRPAET